MSASYVTYIVNQGDTLEGIAQQQLGDWARWKEIAGLNNLRYPFISDRPERWFGPEISTGALLSDIGPLTSTLNLPGERADVLLYGGVFFVDGYLPNNAGNNTYAYDAVTINAYDPIKGVLVFLASGAQFTHSWPAGTRYRVFLPPADLSTKVAKPGDRIFLPLVASSTGNILDQQTALDLYGTDIELTTKGQLTLANGDLKTVSGIDNISQALRFRSQLPYGSYLVHTDEGNKCYFLIGETVRPETPLRAAAFIKEALETDPRVASVPKVMSDVSRPDQIAVGATVQLARTEEQVTVNTLLRNRL